LKSGAFPRVGAEGMSSIAVVIPCFRVKKHISAVIGSLGSEVSRIYVVDDACPEATGKFVEETVDDDRVQVLYQEQNGGVGAAVIAGYRQAVADGAAVIVKIDGDGQMDPALIPRFVRPIVTGEADYTKGNRFWDIEGLRSMPWLRFLGNAALSFVSKLSSGYWDLFDPTNGYTAIHADVVRLLPLDRVSPRWFFESDMLFRLNTIRAAVAEIPMDAHYADESSNLRPGALLGEFALKHARNFVKRIFYSYFLRGFSIASVNLVVGGVLMSAGTWWGFVAWAGASRADTFASSGQVMLAALPILIGVQLVLAFLSYDMASTPRDALHPRL
jgi:glycosyltransferase involved in cell wall biosynthesis